MFKPYKFTNSILMRSKSILSKIRPSTFFKSKWNLLYLALAALILFSVFVMPKIAVSIVEQSRGQVITVESSES